MSTDWRPGLKWTPDPEGCGQLHEETEHFDLAVPLPDCPFCGADELHFARRWDEETGNATLTSGRWTVDCAACGARGPEGEDRDQAEDRWCRSKKASEPPRSATGGHCPLCGLPLTQSGACAYCATSQVRALGCRSWLREQLGKAIESAMVDSWVDEPHSHVVRWLLDEAGFDADELAKIDRTLWDARARARARAEEIE